MNIYQFEFCILPLIFWVKIFSIVLLIFRTKESTFNLWSYLHGRKRMFYLVLYISHLIEYYYECINLPLIYYDELNLFSFSIVEILNKG